MTEKPNRSLADRYGDAKARLAAYETIVSELRDLILETGEDKLTGEDHIVTVTNGAQSRIDTRAVRAILTPEQLAKVTKTSDFYTLRVRPVPKEDEA